MRTFYRVAASAARAASVAVLAASIAIGAATAREGSTDIYANDFGASFGISAGSHASLPFSYSGSTDLWGVDGLRASFGVSDQDVRPANLCGIGSTDTWGVNGFRASFGPPTSRASNELAQACESVPR
jgi:hypothetical protein